MIDIVDIKSKVKNKELEFYLSNGCIYCKNVKTEETVNAIKNLKKYHK